MNADLITTPLRHSTTLRVFVRPLQYFFLVAILASAPARAIELRPGNVYRATFTDVDRQHLSTSDGHVTIITVVTRKDEQKAQQVGDRIPRVCVGDPKFRLITLVNFQQNIFPPFRGMVMAIIRNRLNAEAKELQKTYTEKHLTRDPRSDILVVADFDGQAVSQLGVAPTSSEFAVFVFDGRGRLVRRWNDVPSADALAAALNEAR
jgi:hypothetical protein